MFKNPRRGRQARNFTTTVPKILDLKSSSEQMFFEILTLGASEIMSTEGTLSNVEGLFTKESGRYIREIKRGVNGTKNPWLL